MAILLVIIGHLYDICGIGIGSVWHIIYSFHMPLFFFLSGFVIKKSSVSIVKFPQFLRGRICRLILPLLSVGTICTYCCRNSDFLTFIGGCLKGGYWYLWVLFVFSVIVFFFNIISEKLCKRRALYDIALAGVIVVILALISKSITMFCSEEMQQILIFDTSFSMLRANVIPFFFGVIVSKYDYVNTIFKNRILYTLALLLYLPLSYFMIEFNMDNGLVRLVIIFSAIVLIGSLFFTASPKAKPIMDKLAYIGTKTLDIYVMHYFVLHSINLAFLREFSETRNGFIVLVAALLLSIVIALTCIFVGYIIRKSRLLGFIFLGDKF